MAEFVTTKQLFIKIGACQEAINFCDEHNLWGLNEQQIVDYFKQNGKQEWLAFWKKNKTDKIASINEIYNLEITETGKYMYIGIDGIDTGKKLFFNSIEDAQVSLDESRKNLIAKFIKERIFINHLDITEDGNEVWHSVSDLDANTKDDNRFQLFNHEDGTYINNLTKIEVREKIQDLIDKYMTVFSNNVIYKQLKYPDGDTGYEEYLKY